MTKVLNLLIAFTITVTAASAQTSNTVNLSKGQKFIIENKFSATSKQEMAGQSIDSKADIFTSNNVEVKNMSDKGYDLATTYTKMAANLTAMGNDMNFDSDKKEDMEGEMGKDVKSMINNPKSVVISKSGKVLSASKDTSKAAGSGMMSMMMQQLMGNAEESGYGLSEAFLVLPAKAKVGDTWSDSTSKNGVSKTTTYKITAINGNEATLAVSGNVTTDTKAEMQGMEVLSKTTGLISGEETVDVKSGIIKTRNTTLDSSGNLEAMGQVIPMSTRLSAVTTVKNM
ncbi:MAG: DUF6263 family protein [Ginsengibacter sp.]